MVALPLDNEARASTYSSEKGTPLPILTQTPKPRSSKSKRNIVLALLGLYFLGLLTVDVYGRWAQSSQQTQVWEQMSMEGKCPAQPAGLEKGVKWAAPANYSMEIAHKLSRAVQIPTVSYDNMGALGEDTRWEIHNKFTAFLEAEFPMTYGALTHEFVNEHGHLFTWGGSNPALQPVLLMAHTDVVPVNDATVNQWTHGPFEGFVDDTWIWGRGSADCKNQLMGIMNAVEKLVSEDFKPERTILIQFGYDEEIGGFRGATALSELIESRYGPNSLAFLVDEGFGGVDEAYGATFASFGMAEKGSTNFEIVVETPGGHSSVPPSHTGIGIISEVLVQMEANPFPAEIKPSNPYVKYLNCLAEHAPDLDEPIRKMILNPKKWAKLAQVLTKDDPKQRAFLGTTQALDLIQGGVKVNALPEQVIATANYRISFTSSIAETKAHVASVIASLAEDIGVEFNAFGENMSSKKTIQNAGGRKISLRVQARMGSVSKAGGLEPAPITPETTESFQLMASTVRAIWSDAIAAPSGMYANTDTRNYWGLTENLYRFLPISTSEFRSAHTVDESVSIQGHLSTVRFFHTLIQNTVGWRQGDELA